MTTTNGLSKVTNPADVLLCALEVASASASRLSRGNSMILAFSLHIPTRTWWCSFSSKLRYRSHVSDIRPNFPTQCGRNILIFIKDTNFHCRRQCNKSSWADAFIEAVDDQNSFYFLYFRKCFIDEIAFFHYVSIGWTAFFCQMCLSRLTIVSFNSTSYKSSVK